MKNKDLVSVILPVYNAEKYLEKTVQSVLEQSYLNFELIIVNDGSKDKSDEICQKYQQQDNRILYFKTDNHGVSSARNYALSQANGTYITFLDADDLYAKNYLEVLISYQKKYHSDLIACSYQTLSAHSNILTYSNNLLDCGLKEYIEILQPNLLFNQLWNKMYKRSIIQQNNLMFDNNLDLGEDYKFNLEYISYTKSQIFINIPLYYYRISNNGLGFKYRKNSNQIKLNLLKKLEKIYLKNHYDLSYVYQNYLIQYCSYFSNIVKKENTQSKKNKLQEIQKIIQAKEYKNKLKEIKNSKNIKYKIFANVLLVNNSYFLYIVGILANFYDIYNKKIKYGKKVK